MPTLILPEAIGHVTALTAGKGAGALSLEGADSSGRTDPANLLKYGTSWLEDHLSFINYLEKIMSKERKSNREEKKQPAMTPKEKKAAKKSRKESRGGLGEHAG
ncbi:MAG: hypothetical protein WBO34_00575 [Gammaproteobacteria bacterium]